MLLTTSRRRECLKTGSSPSKRRRARRFPNDISIAAVAQCGRGLDKPRACGCAPWPVSKRATTTTDDETSISSPMMLLDLDLGFSD